MPLASVSALAGWDNFYVIIGSSAGALTGLTFVVVTLVGERRGPDSSVGVNAYSSPTVVHFSLTLLIAALLSAPWPTLTPVAVLLALVGLGGLLYVGIVMRRLRQHITYQPVLEDWLWHSAFPLAAYLALLVAAILLSALTILALFVIAATMLLLVFVGIHNAWDTLTYVATVLNNGRNETGNEQEVSAPEQRSPERTAE